MENTQTPAAGKLNEAALRRSGRRTSNTKEENDFGDPTGAKRKRTPTGTAANTSKNKKTTRSAQMLS